MLGYYASAVLPDAFVLGLIVLSPLFVALILAAVHKAGERASLILGCLIVPLVHRYFPSVDLLITGVVGGSLGFILGRTPVVRRLLA